MKALIIVDVQNDFCPGGSLAVPKGDQVVEVINKIRDKYEIVIFTLDSHPEDHCSFKENGGMWPPHCVISTNGRELHKDLITKGEDRYVSKGTFQDADSYSGFFDDNKEPTVLVDFVKDLEIDEVDICGLASEYCVAFTARHAIKLGLKTKIIKDACRGIDADNELNMFNELSDLGCIFTKSELIQQEL